MNRNYKNFSPDTVFHIYNRGNNKDKIFLDDQDYRSFLYRLGLVLGIEEPELQKLFFLPYSRIRISAFKKDDFRIHAFCLMPTHFHIIIEQKKEEVISKLISRICTSYAKYFNRKYKRVGHLFQDEFKSVRIESNAQLMWTISYVHMNPVKDKLSQHPEQYQWSSYPYFINNDSFPLIYRELVDEIFGKRLEKETLALSVKETL